MRHFFLKDINKFPVACIASAIRNNLGGLTDGPLEPDSTVVYAMSIHNPKDEFNRGLARDIAYARLSKGKYTVSGAGIIRPIKYGILTEIAYEMRIHPRVKEAAIRWLDIFDARARVLAIAPNSVDIQPDIHSALVDVYSIPIEVPPLRELTVAGDTDIDLHNAAATMRETAILDKIFSEHPPEREHPWTWSSEEVVD